MIENQEELRAALETEKAQKDKILQLEEEKSQLESRLSAGIDNALVEDLQIQVLAYHKSSFESKYLCTRIGSTSSPRGW